MVSSVQLQPKAPKEEQKAVEEAKVEEKPQEQLKTEEKPDMEG